MKGLKEALHAPAIAGAASEVVRHRVTTLVNMQKRLLDAAAEQAHAVAESYRHGNGLMAGASAAELVQRRIEDFSDTEKRFLELTTQELTAAVEDLNESDKPARKRRALRQLARKGIEQYIDVQKKLLELVIEHLEATDKPSQGTVAACEESATSWTELAEKSVQNFVTAEKALIDLIKSTRRRPEKTPKGIPVPVRSRKKAFNAKKDKGRQYAIPA